MKKHRVQKLRRRLFGANHRYGLHYVPREEFWVFNDDGFADAVRDLKPGECVVRKSGNSMMMCGLGVPKE